MRDRSIKATGEEFHEPGAQRFIYNMIWFYFSSCLALAFPFVFIGLYLHDPSKFEHPSYFLPVLAMYWGGMLLSIYYRIARMPAAITVEQSEIRFRFPTGREARWQLADLETVTIKHGLQLIPVRDAFLFRRAGTQEKLWASIYVVQGHEALRKCLEEKGISVVNEGVKEYR